MLVSSKYLSRAGTFGFRLLGALGSALLAFTIAKLGSSEILGEFQYALTIALGISILAKQGYDRVLIRFIARYKDTIEERIGNMLFKLALRKVLLRSLILLPLVYFSLMVLEDFVSISQAAYWIIAASIPMSFGALLVGFYKGSFKPSTSFIYDIGVISLIASAIIYISNNIEATSSAKSIYISYFVCYSFIVGIGLCINKRALSIKVSEAIPWQEMSTASPNFMWMTLIVYAQQLVLVYVLAEYLGISELGIYKVAEKIAITIGFFQSVVNAIYAPYFSKSHHTNDIKKLVRYIRQSTTTSLILTVPPLLIIFLFTTDILNYFGPDYTDASTLVYIISIGQFINVILSPSGTLLNMTGNEAISKRILIATSVISIPLIVSFTLIFGAVGTATAGLIIIAAQNIGCTAAAYKILGVIPYAAIR